MERTWSDEEKIRRAEEIYNRRKMQGVRVSTSTVNATSKREYRLFNKMVLQIIICMVIYFIFYLIQNSNYIFSEGVINKTKEILSYNINVQEQMQMLMNNIENFSRNKNNTEQEVKQEDVNNEETLQQNTDTEENIITDTLSMTTEEPNIVDTSNLSQMEIDAQEIKNKYSLIKPIIGTITSKYGIRNPTTETVPKNHTGIDIAANTGTDIIAAMEGEVVQVSGIGDYRESCKNPKWRCNNFICTL